MDKIIHDIITSNWFWFAIAILIFIFFLVVTYYLFQTKTNKLYFAFTFIVTGIYLFFGLINIVNSDSYNEALQAFLDFVSTFEVPILFLLIDKILLSNKNIEKQPQQNTSNIKIDTQATQDIEKTIEKLQSDINEIKSKIDNTLQQQTSKINTTLRDIQTELAKLKERTDSTTPKDETTGDTSSTQQS